MNAIQTFVSGTSGKCLLMNCNAKDLVGSIELRSAFSLLAAFDKVIVEIVCLRLEMLKRNRYRANFLLGLNQNADYTLC